MLYEGIKQDEGLRAVCLLAGPVPHGEGLVDVRVGQPGLHRVECEHLDLQHRHAVLLEGCCDGPMAIGDRRDQPL